MRSYRACSSIWPSWATCHRTTEMVGERGARAGGPYAPESLLEQLGIRRPEDIDVEVIAQFCGATVTYELLVACEARVLGLGNRAIITVNSESIEPRRRFSA